MLLLLPLLSPSLLPSSRQRPSASRSCAPALSHGGFLRQIPALSRRNALSVAAAAALCALPGARPASAPSPSVGQGANPNPDPSPNHAAGGPYARTDPNANHKPRQARGRPPQRTPS
eukprot:scaffold45193_cov43-Phaeocystis_antarctica.AAC.2